MKNKNLKDLKITIHQINTEVGNIEGNLEKVMKCLTSDEKTNVHVFPETTLTGYLCGSLYDRIDFVKENERALEQIVKECSKESKLKDRVVIIGYVSYHGMNESGFPIIKNSVACINQGKVQTYDKQLLATNDHHEDRKYFQEGTETKVFDVTLGFKGLPQTNLTIGCPICEDNWFTDHDRNIPEEMVKLGADIIISINQSYFYYGKQLKRYNLFSTIAKHNNVPVVMVNNVGLGDVVKNIISYDGGSMIFNEDGKLVCKLKSFEEINRTFFLDSEQQIDGEIQPNKYQEILQSLVYTTKEFFRLQNISKAQVHISGGLDSAIVACITAMALPKQDIIFISNPSSCNGDETKSNAQEIADNLGIRLYWNPIEKIYQKIKMFDELAFKDSSFEIPNTGLSSMQAVLRTVQSLAANHRFGSATICTGNHTENSLGWYSFSDVGSTGIMQIIGDLTKIELYELAEFINDCYFEYDLNNQTNVVCCLPKDFLKIVEEINKNTKSTIETKKLCVIPQTLYNGMCKPAAELPDANEDPIDYWVQSGICAELIRNRKTLEDIMFEYKHKLLSLDHFPKQHEVYKYSESDFSNQVMFAISKIKRSVYKGAQSAPVVVISPRSRGFSSRETLINKYNK